MTRSTPLPRRRQRLDEVADGERPGRVGLALGRTEELVDVAAGDVGELLAALVGRDPAARARPRAAASRSARRSRRRPRPRGRRGRCRPSPRSGRRPWGRPRPPRAASRPRTRVSSGRKTRYSPPAEEVTREPLLTADQVVVVEVAPVGEEALAGLEADVVAAALLVGEPDPLPRAQRPPVHAGPGLGGTSGASALVPARGAGEGVGHAANPTRPGPRQPSAGGGPEGPVDVGGDEHAEDAAVVLDEDVLRGRGAGDREDQVLAPRASAGRLSPSSRVRATVLTATHGRRSSGVASSAASLTTPTGSAARR